MFFTFRQNNSGGHFIQDDDVDVYTIIEADNADEATSKALEVGIYFNGCSTGSDCECCGDRWYEIDDDDGYEVPSLYEPIEEGDKDWVVHFKDGTVVRYTYGILALNEVNGRFTKEDFFKALGPHPIGKGSIAKIALNNDFTLSAIGGAPGLMGDGVNTFEIAIVDNSTHDLIQLPNLNDSVMGWVEVDKIVQFVGRFKKGEYLDSASLALKE